MMMFLTSLLERTLPFLKTKRIFNSSIWVLGSGTKRETATTVLLVYPFMVFVLTCVQIPERVAPFLWRPHRVE